MNASHLSAIWILCLLLWAPTAAGQGFAGLGTNSDGFAAVTPGTKIRFPDDFGPHPDHRIEWWYVTANLTTEDGQQMGLQWTLFRQAAKPGLAGAGWSSHEFWMGHAAVTTATGHYSAEKLARGGTGQAGARATSFDAWIDDWQFAKNDDKPAPGGSYRLAASAEAFRYELSLSAQMAPVLHGEDGFSRKSDAGHASYYFSIPSFSVSGSIEIDGQRHKVTGEAWLDREWSSQPLSGSQEGWDWFSLRLDSGDYLMLFQLRDSLHPAYLSGSWVSADGTLTSLEGTGIILTPLESVHTAGRDVPVRWRIEIPSRALRIETDPLWPHSWMDTSIAYWEGPVTAKGTHPATGYLEMTGY